MKTSPESNRLIGDCSGGCNLLTDLLLRFIDRQMFKDYMDYLPAIKQKTQFSLCLLTLGKANFLPGLKCHGGKVVGIH